MKKTLFFTICGLLIISSLSQNIIIRNPGCNSYDQNGICKSCSTRFYKDKNNICQPINSNCKTYNQINGDCLSCYPGFGLIEGTCLPGLDSLSIMDPNCNKFQDNICVKCSFGYYFEKNGKCTKADPNCQTFNQLNGACTSCYPGFNLSSGKCIREAIKISDLNCNQLDDKGICIKCSSGYYFKQQICTKIDDFCKDFDTVRGICLGCYSGYSLNSANLCVKDAIKQNMDPNCAQWRDNICLSCSKGSMFNQFRICTLLDSNCKSYSSQSGICTSCYSGYDLSNGGCSKAIVQSVTDSNCNQFNSNGKCTKCSVGFYFNNLQICTKIDDSCKSFSISNARCLQCYSGYQLSSTNQCIKVVQNVTDVNCAQWNGKICVKCSFGASFNKQGLCITLDVQCKEYEQATNICKLCYQGYELNISKICVKSAVQSIKDSLCAEWNGDVCLKCSQGSYYSTSTKLCTLIDSSCRTANQVTGMCLSCYDGYQLNLNKNCVKVIESVSDPNCAQWNGKLCKKCSIGSAFNNLGKCFILDTQCRQYDQITSVCKSCYQGYQLNISKACTKSAVQAVKDPLCAQWNNDVCLKCSQGSFFNANRICTLIDSSCKSANQITGECLSCFDGYQLNSSKVCVRVVEQVSDLNCAQWKGKVCLKCSFGAVFNNLGKCIILDTQCKQYDQLTGICSGCYPGYTLNNLKVCIKSGLQAISDPLCAQWKQQICMKCSSGSFFSNKRVCTQIDPSCRAANSLTGACLGCYDGYQLTASGNCQKVIEEVSDVNCAQWNGKICKKCSLGSAFNNQGICKILDPQCKQYDQVSMSCRACYQGYQLNSLRICIKSAIQTLRDPLCAQWKGDNCIKCSIGSYYASNKLCALIDSSCKTSNPMTGQCLGCYDGYQLSLSKTCTKIIQNVSDPNCAEWNGKICIKCSIGATFNDQRICIILDSQCKEYNQTTKLCRECYLGYQLNKQRICLKSAIQVIRDSLCAQWNGDVCLKCSTGSYLSKNGLCTQVDPSCQSFNKLTGDCLSCYPGYSLSSGSKCTKSTQQNNNNPQCSQWQDKVCVRCSAGSFFNGLGICDTVDPLCKTSNILNGACTSCFNGYKVSGSKCVIAQEDARDPLCAQFDGLKCKQCSFGAFFNSKGICQIADALCESFNKNTGICLSCYPGHILVAGKCQVDKNYALIDPFCASYQNQICTKCATGYYFQKDGKCTAVDTLCATFNPLNGRCLSCFNGYELQSGFCVRAKQVAKDPNCAVFKDNTCTQCSKGYIFNQNKVCNLINPLCRTYNMGTGACTGCYSGYKVQNSTCVLDASVSDSNCAQFIDNICIRCASRAYMNSKGTCQKISQDCRTYNDFSGQCLSCYSGFVLNKAKCIKDEVKGGCSQLDINGNCIRCGTGFYINNGICVQIDSQCAKFNMNIKMCQGCYNGYRLLQGRCQISQVNKEYQIQNCIAYNTDNKCIQCFDRYYLSNNQCKQVNVFCKTYDIITGACNSCYSIFKLINGQCKQ